MNTKFIHNLFKLRGDKIIWGVFFILSFTSIALVYSASSMVAVSQYGGSNLQLLIKQIGIVVSGFFIIIIASFVNYKKLKKPFLIAFLVLIPILLITIVLGRNVNSASRWLQIPIIGVSLQVGDLAKLILIGVLSFNISKLPFIKKQQISERKYIILALFLPLTLIVGLIVRGNMSTAILLMTTAFFIMWLGKIKIKYMLSYTGILVALFLAVVLIKPDAFPRLETWKSRMIGYQNNNTTDKKAKSESGNYQLLRAKIAIASAPLFGKLPGKSRQRALLYSAHTDFIFAILIEEYSLFAGIVMVLLFMILVYRGQLISRQNSSIYGSLLAYGLIFGIVIQAFIHMLVNTALIPVTGQPLPLVSMGGSNFWITCLSLGILQNIAYQNKQEQIAATAELPQK